MLCELFRLWIPYSILPFIKTYGGHPERFTARYGLLYFTNIFFSWQVLPDWSLVFIMENYMTPLSTNDTFLFSCSKKVSCFNECCRDLNQFLTPYDILRLKHHLDLSSNIFLERYTTQQVGPETGLPIITLKPEAQVPVCDIIRMQRLSRPTIIMQDLSAGEGRISFQSNK